MGSVRGGIALALLVASCGFTGLSVGETLTTDVLSAPALASTTVPSLPCGAAFPVFAAGFDRSDPLNVDGTLDPGPESVLADPDQLVSHWLHDYGVLELRWPPIGGPIDPVGWDWEFVGFPAHLAPTTGSRQTLFVLVDESGGPCSQFSVEVYGPRPDPLQDVALTAGDFFRNRAELPGYLEAERARVTPSRGGLGRPIGQCGEAVFAELDDFGAVEVRTSLELARRFLADRAAGFRAEQCLTESALADYLDADQSEWPTLCLFACDDGAVFVGSESWAMEEVGHNGEAAIVSVVVDFAGPERTAREDLEIVPIATGEGPMVALISAVFSQPDSYVDRLEAEVLVSDFLGLLAGSNYESAAEYLVNEGFSPEVDARLGDVWNSDLALLLEDFCRHALCAVPHEIVGNGETQLNERGVIVRFHGPSGAVVAPIGVGIFEGRLSITSLPPNT